MNGRARHAQLNNGGNHMVRPERVFTELWLNYTEYRWCSNSAHINPNGQSLPPFHKTIVRLTEFLFVSLDAGLPSAIGRAPDS